MLIIGNMHCSKQRIFYNHAAIKIANKKWFVFDNTKSPICPFCGTHVKGTVPVLDLYYEFKPTVWKPENHRLMVYNNQYLFQWHVNRNIVRNERLTAEQKSAGRVFYFLPGQVGPG